MRDTEYFDDRGSIKREREDRPHRILVVDDEESIGNYLTSVFFRYGHHCEIAKDAEEALARIKQNKFDSAVIDVVMPLMDGLTLTREILKWNPEFPVMIMTGHAEEYPAQLALSSGAREFIHKPFSVEEFILRYHKMMKDHQIRETLLPLSLTDELTGLYNRRRFFVLTEQYLKVAIRAQKRLLLLYIDMDDLKWINDHYGHLEGDRALIEFAKILKKTFRESDIVARIGGDEFMVLFECTDQKDETLLNRLDENIKDYNARETRPYPLSISVGVAPFDPEHPVPIDELLSKADASMYVHKKNK